MGRAGDRESCQRWGEQGTEKERGRVVIEVRSGTERGEGGRERKREREW